MYLWSGLLSPFSAKVRIYLAERQIDCEVKEIPWSKQNLWGPKPAEFLQVSPRAEVPVLVDGDLAVFDSTLIWEYLEDSISANSLLPDGTVLKTQCRMWEDRADHAMSQHLTTLIRDVYMTAGGQNAPPTDDEAVARIAGATAALQAYYSDLEAALEHAQTDGAGDHLCGAYSIADIATFVCITFCQTLGAPVPAGHTRLTQWYTRLSQRPVIAAETGDILAGAAAA